MQIAKMFASLGFKVDNKGLEDFKNKLNSIKSELSNLSQDSSKANDSLKNLKTALSDVRKELEKIKKGSGSISGTSNTGRLNTTAKKLNEEFDKLIERRKQITNSIGKINASVASGTPIWDKYRESVVKTRKALHNINGEVKSLRANSRISVRDSRGVLGGGGYRGGGGRYGSDRGAFGGGMYGQGGILGFLRGGILPATALTGGATAAGYVAKELVQSGREQTKMESMLQMTSKSSESFARTLEYVRGEAERLGLSSVELGKSFAQINMSAKTLSQDQKEEMFTGFSEFMMAMGTNKDDQKGIFRAFNQMFSNNRILQEEINQLSERGIPATLVQDAAMKAYGTDNIKYIKKLQEDGKLDPSKVLPVMAKMVQEMAHSSGAYEKMMNSSIVKQGQFIESLRRLSKEVMDSGLDEALGKLFGKATEFVNSLLPAIEGLKWLVKKMQEAKKASDDLLGSNTILIAALVLFFARLRSIIAALKNTESGLGKVRRIFDGAFGRALGKTILRFTGWIGVIYSVIQALKFLGNELEKKESGEYSIFDAFEHQMTMLGLKIDLAKEKMKLFFTEMKYFAKDASKYMGFDAAVGDALGWAFGGIFPPSGNNNAGGRVGHGILRSDYNGGNPQSMGNFTPSTDDIDIQSLIDNNVISRPYEKLLANIPITVINKDNSQTRFTQSVEVRI